MKSIFKNIISKIIAFEAILIIKKYKPSIIAVTGSVGKTSTKDAIFAVMSGSSFVRKSEKSFNSDIGIPLTILGCSNAWFNPILWMKNILTGLGLIIFNSEYPKWLILEVGADRPRDIQKVIKSGSYNDFFADFFTKFNRERYSLFFVQCVNVFSNKHNSFC